MNQNFTTFLLFFFLPQRARLRLFTMHSFCWQTQSTVTTWPTFCQALRQSPAKRKPHGAMVTSSWPLSRWAASRDSVAKLSSTRPRDAARIWPCTLWIWLGMVSRLWATGLRTSRIIATTILFILFAAMRRKRSTWMRSSTDTWSWQLNW